MPEQQRPCRKSQLPLHLRSDFTVRNARSHREEELAYPGRRRSAIPKSRALVCDLLSLERSLPTVAHCRDFDLAKVAAAREAVSEKIAWPILFVKAFALVAQENPALRQAWIRFPFPYLYLHPHSVAFMSVKRFHEGEEWLLFASFTKPESQGLSELNHRLDCYKTEPIDQVFRQHFKAAHLPAFLRRSLMWIWLNWMGKRRSRKMGTFGLTTVGSRGTVIQNPPGMLTSTLTYGPFNEEQKSRVTISYDHRIMDGWYVAEMLEALEETLNGPIAEELAGMADETR